MGKGLKDMNFEQLVVLEERQLVVSDRVRVRQRHLS